MPLPHRDAEAAPQLLIEPDAPALLSLLSRRRSAALSGSAPASSGADLPELAQRTRAELGLAADAFDGPVIGVGHQAAFWHPGIVAKLLCAVALAQRVEGRCVHVIVEQDPEPVASVLVPVRNRDGELAAETVSMLTLPPQRVPLRVPAAAPVPAALPSGVQPALPSIERGLRAMAAALGRRREERNVAWQVTQAAFDLLSEQELWAAAAGPGAAAAGPGAAAPRLVGASSLLTTSAGREMLERMAADPLRCAETYNEAVAAVPGAASPLSILRDRVELPLWRLDDEGRRLRAWEDDVDRFHAGEITLLPKALTMTALLRLAVCDLFLHGTGGAAYDVAMERWIGAWLGPEVSARDGGALAPAAAASATLLLPFGVRPPRVADADAAARALRTAWFDPELLSEPESPRRVAGSAATGPGPHKRALLEAIAAAPRGSQERRAAFRAMHRELAAMREARREELARLEAEREEALRWRRQAPILASRTWAFPFHQEASLRSLAQEIAARVQGG